MSLTAAIEYFVHPKLRVSPDSFWKAKILIGAHFLLAVVGFFLSAFTVINGVSQAAFIWVPICLIPVCLLSFKKSGNLIFYGNLATAIYAFYMTPLPYFTGGIYSDDIIWLLVAPMMAFTLTNLRSGFFWTAYVLIVQGIYFYLEAGIDVPIAERIEHWTPEYYYLSIAFFFFITLMTIAASKFGVMQIIEQLIEQKALLNKKTRELEKKTEQLRMVEKTLRSSNEELEQFAYVVSHDLKAPLRSINSFSNLLQKNLGRKYELDEASLEYLDFIKMGTVNMNQLIEDIMTYSRASSVKDEKDTSVKMEELKILIEHNLRQSIDDTNAELVWQNIPETIDMAKVQMLQLLQNLISNAIKYRKDNIPPLVIISVKDEPTFWKFSIQDNGTGISEENLKKVFDLFIKLPGTNQEGSGIGLATCKKIVSNCGGEIWLDSKLNVGSTFHFSIPKKRFAEDENEVQTVEDNLVVQPSFLN